MELNDRIQFSNNKETERLHKESLEILKIMSKA